MSITLVPLNRSNLTQQVMESVAEYIRKSRLQPGDRLPSEKGLSDALNCSRTSVREALCRLEAVGMIEVHVGKGAFVADQTWPDMMSRFSHLLLTSIRDFRELVEARIAIESTIAELAAEKITSEQVSELEKIVDRFDDAGADSNEVDMSFHGKLLEIADNALLANFSELLRRFFAETPRGSAGDPSDTVKHRILLAAVRSGDLTAARKAIADHIGPYLQSYCGDPNAEFRCGLHS